MLVARCCAFTRAIVHHAFCTAKLAKQDSMTDALPEHPRCQKWPFIPDHTKFSISTQTELQSCCWWPQPSAPIRFILHAPGARAAVLSVTPEHAALKASTACYTALHDTATPLLETTPAWTLSTTALLLMHTTPQPPHLQQLRQHGGVMQHAACCSQ